MSQGKARHTRKADYRMRLLSDEELERFVAKIVPVQQGNWHCWEWTGKRDRFGYARFWLDGQWRAAHRLAFVGMVAGSKTPQRRRGMRPLDLEYQLDHLCNNESCVRPSHLLPMLHRTNQELKGTRMRRKVTRREARELAHLHIVEEAA